VVDDTGPKRKHDRVHIHLVPLSPNTPEDKWSKANGSI
jgi:hypothetical protein